MNRYTLIAFGFLPVFVIAGVVLLLVFGNTTPRRKTSTEGMEKELALYGEVRQLLLDHFDGEVDEGKLADEALVGLSKGTGDGYTHVNPPFEAKAQEIDLDGQSFGINCSVERNEDGSIRITQVHNGGGGEKAGLLADDVIVAVDGTSIFGQPWSATEMRIKSKVEGSVVKIDVQRGGDPKRGDDPKGKRLAFDVSRSQVVLYSVNDVHIELRHGKRLGYIAVSEFNSNTFNPQFKDALAKLTQEGAEGLVVDLRMNGGGRVPSAVDMADAFLSAKDQLIVFTHSNREQNRAADRAYKTADEEALCELPLVLLVDGGTASASEIFAGAMKDHGRALIVGQRTFGKGLVQSIYKLQTDERYSVNITTTQYYTPLGRRVQKGEKGEPGGIIPDIIVKYRPGEQNNIAQRLGARRAVYNRETLATTNKWWNIEDRMLEAALDVLCGKPVKVKDAP